MKIENLENDLKLVTYEGLQDKSDVEALVESEELQNARYDKFNLITSKRCARPTWSLVVGKNRKPKLFRLVKDALKKYKLVSGPAVIITISDEGVVTLSVQNGEGFTIHYTYGEDPADPTTESTEYTESFTVNEGETVKAFGFKAGDPEEGTEDESTPIASKKYEKEPVPVFPDVVNINISEDGLVTLTCATEGAEIYYSTGSTQPQSGNKYTAAFTVEDGTKVNAVAKLGDNYGEATSATYTAPVVIIPETPEISFDEEGNTTITATTGDEIRYTTDGSNPTAESDLYTVSFQVANGTTVKAIAIRDGVSSEVASETFVAGTVATPVINFDPDGTVHITCSTAGAIIRYTDDGNDPDENSEVFSSLQVLSHTTVKAIAYKNGVASEIASRQFIAAEPDVPVITFSQDGTAKATIECETTGADIYYTINGDTPTENDTKYTAPFDVEQSDEVKAIAYQYGEFSQAASATYNAPTCATPEINPSSSSVEYGSTITISTLEAGVTIRYEVGGAEPDADSPEYPAGGITVDQENSFTVKAFAMKAGYKASAIAEKTYTVTLPQLATPTFDIPSGTYMVADGEKSVRILSADDGTTIHYTLDETAPTADSPVYGLSIPVSQNTVIKAIAVKDHAITSSVGTATYNMKLSTPTISPDGSTYNTAQNVTIESADATINPDIYYTSGNNPSDPTDSDTQYTSAIQVDSSTTIKAIAIKDGYTSSDVASESYVIEIPVVDDPTFNLDTGTYEGNQTIRLSCTTQGAAIHYTTDGTNPDQNSATYDDNNPITVSTTTTISAIAMKANYIDSQVVTKTYTITHTAATPTFSEDDGATVYVGDSVTISSTTPNATIYYTTDNSNPVPDEGTTQQGSSVTISGSGSITIKAIATANDYSDSAVASVTYTVATHVTATPTFDQPEGEVPVNTVVTISCATPNATIYYTYGNNPADPTSSSPDHGTAGSSVTVTVDSDMTIKAIAVVGGNYEDSAIASRSYTIPGAVMHSYYGFYDLYDDGMGGYDDETELTQAQIDGLVADGTFAFDLIYNNKTGSVVERTVTTSPTLTGPNNEELEIIANPPNPSESKNCCQVVYAYPNSLGDLTSVKSQGGEAITSLTKLTATIDGVSYNIYVSDVKPSVDNHSNPTQFQFAFYKNN